MKILKSLSKNFFFIFIILIIKFNSLAEDQPVDIWNIDKKEEKENSIISNPSFEKEIKDKKELESKGIR